MDYINTSVKDLKQLKIHTDVRKDPLFQSLMNVCRNDKKNLDLLKQESTSFVSHSFFDCFWQRLQRILSAAHICKNVYAYGIDHRCRSSHIPLDRFRLASGFVLRCTAESH